MYVFQLNGACQVCSAVYTIALSSSDAHSLHAVRRRYDESLASAFEALLRRQKLRNNWKTTCADTIGWWALGGRAFARAASTIISTTITSSLTRRWFLRPGGSSSLREGRRAEEPVDPCSRCLSGRGAMGRSDVRVPRWIRKPDRATRVCVFQL